MVNLLTSKVCYFPFHCNVGCVEGRNWTIGVSFIFFFYLFIIYSQKGIEVVRTGKYLLYFVEFINFIKLNQVHAFL